MSEKEACPASSTDCTPSPGEEKGMKRPAPDSTSEGPKVHSANDWEHADLGDDGRKNKFLRLMGASKKEHQGRFVIGDNQRQAHRPEGEQNLTGVLENQFQHSMDYQLQGGRRAHLGLGYQKEPEANAENADGATEAKAGVADNTIEAKAGEADNTIEAKAGEADNTIEAKAGEADNTIEAKAGEADNTIEAKAGEADNTIEAKAGEADNTIEAKAGDAEGAIEAKAGEAEGATQPENENAVNATEAAAVVALETAAVLDKAQSGQPDSSGDVEKSDSDKADGNGESSEAVPRGEGNRDGDKSAANGESVSANNSSSVSSSDKLKKIGFVKASS